MELSESDIRQIKELTNNTNLKWVREKRKPLLSDYGLKEEDLEKISHFKRKKSTDFINEQLDRLHGCLIVFPLYCFFYAPIIVGIPMAIFSRDKDILGLIVGPYSIFIGFVCIFYVPFSNWLEKHHFCLKKSKKEIMYDKKLTYDKHLALYEKWLIYNQIEEEKHQERIALYKRNVKYFPYYTVFTKEFKIFYKLDAQYWRELDAFDFEKKVGELFKTQFGYNVSITKKSGDGGVDIILRKDARKKYVQCKHYCYSNKLGVTELREFFGVCAADSVKGIMVCTSSLTSDAYSFYKKTKNTIELIGLNDLVRLSVGMQPFSDICDKLTSLFKKYLFDNKFLYFTHCYILQECFMSEEAANTRISKLHICEDPRFCYKIIHIVDQNSFNYYIIAFVEAKFSCQYNEFKINLSVSVKSL